jgi:hypothetical protein
MQRAWGKLEVVYSILVDKPRQRGHMGNVRVDGLITLTLVLGKQHVMMWTGFNWFRMATYSETFLRV